jgi:iron complex transport system ATP-binding protein
MLEARGLTYVIDGHTLLAGIDLTVRPGRITVLIGPNGAGKSTLLRLLSGELRPTRGAVLLDGRALATLPAAELARRRAVVPQSSALSFPFTAYEVVMLGVSVPGFDGAGGRSHLAGARALDTVGLTSLANRLYVHLSGGERQRVHFARALSQLWAGARRAGETCCFLLDEPTASLDLAHQTIVLAALREQARTGVAVVAVLHDLNLAACIADELVLLERGRILAAGTTADVLSDDTLSAAYGCRVQTNRAPPDGRPFVLPPAAFERPVPDIPGT